MIRIAKSLAIAHGIHDVFMKNWMIPYFIFPFYFLFLNERIIQGLIFFGTIYHFSKDLIFIPHPYSEILLSFLLLLGYKFKNKNTIQLLVYLYLFLHSLRVLYININKKEKMLVLALFYFCVYNSDYLRKSVDDLIKKSLIMNTKNRLILGVVFSHILIN